MSGRRDEADEAYSRTAVQALQKWPDDLRDVEHAKAWLLAVARNICMDLYRERRRSREISLDSDVDETQGDRAVFALPVLPGPEDQYVEREQGLLLRACIDQLPPLLRHTATLHFVGEMPYGDVARQLGITEVNVRKRIQQARERLRAAVRTSSARVLHARPRVPTPPPPGEPLVPHAMMVTTATGLQRDVVLELPLPRGSDARRAERLQSNIHMHPRSRSARLELARLFASRGLLDEAVPLYRFVLAKQCFPIRPWLELGAVLEALGQTNEAAALYASGAVEAGREADRAHLRALELFLRRLLRQARLVLHEAIARTPDSARDHRLLGRVALECGDLAGAVQSLEHCLELEPCDPLAPLLLHRAWAVAGRPDEARAQLERALAADPKHPAALERLIAELSDGSEEERRRAETLLPALRAVAPDTAGTRGCQSLVMRAAGMRDSEAPIAGYVGLHLRHAAAWRWLAAVRRRSGLAALGAATMARDLDPSDRDSWLELCGVLAAATNPVEARRVAEAVRTRFPHDCQLLRAAALLAPHI